MCGIGGFVLPLFGGATRGKGGGAFVAPGSAGAADTAPAGTGAAGGAPAATTAGGAAAAGAGGAGAFGFSLNLPPSAAAGTSAAGALGAAAVGEGGIMAGGGMTAGMTAGGGFATGAATTGLGTGAVAAAGVAGTAVGSAMTRGFNRIFGAPFAAAADSVGSGAAGAGAGTLGAGTSATGAAAGGIVSAGAAADEAGTAFGSLIKRGLKRILGCASAVAAGSETGIETGVAEAGADAAGALAAGAADEFSSAERRRGFRRNAGGGVCSSLMNSEQSGFSPFAKPKRFARGQTRTLTRCSHLRCSCSNACHCFALLSLSSLQAAALSGNVLRNRNKAPALRGKWRKASAAAGSNAGWRNSRRKVSRQPRHRARPRRNSAKSIPSPAVRKSSRAPTCRTPQHSWRAD
jgi:hypothetical protein